MMVDASFPRTHQLMLNASGGQWSLRNLRGMLNRVLHPLGNKKFAAEDPLYEVLKITERFLSTHGLPENYSEES